MEVEEGCEMLLAEGFLLDLPPNVRMSVSQLLDRRSLGALSATCKVLRDFALNEARVVRVPNATNGRDLLNSALQKLPHAQRLCLSGGYEFLSPSCLEAFLTQRLPSLARSLCQLHLHGARLSQPLPVSLLMYIPELWPTLERLEIVDTKINCPMSFTKRETLVPLVHSLLDIEDGGVSHPLQAGYISLQVDEHETRLDRNILVSLEVCRMAGRLPRLRHLALRGPRYLHLHNLAVMALAGCTQLATIELDLPPSWPTVTLHAISTLPQSVTSLTLGCQLPVTYLRQLAKSDRVPMVHMQVDFEPPSRPAGLMSGPGRDGGGGDTFRQEYELLQHQGSEHHYTGTLMGVLAGSGGSVRCVCVCVWLEHHRMDALGVLAGGGGWGGGGAGSSSGTTGIGALYPLVHPLPIVAQLASLSIRSSVPDLDPAELSDGAREDWERRQRQEGVMLRALLAAAPQLQALELSSVGPLLFEAVTTAVETVPRKSLRLSCHSTVDPMPLLRCAVAAPDVGLTLRGVAVPDLLLLCEAGGSSPVSASGTGNGDDGCGGQDNVPTASSSGSGTPTAMQRSAARGGGDGGGTPTKATTSQQQQPRPLTRTQRVQLAEQLSEQIAAAAAAALPPPRQYGGAAAAVKKGGGAGGGGGSGSGSGGKELSKKAANKAAAAQAARVAEARREASREAARVAAAAAAAAELLAAAQRPTWSTLHAGAPVLARLTRLHLQRSHDVTDADVTAAVASCSSLRHLQLTTCRAVSPGVVTQLASLRRPMRLRCVSCRLVTSAGWAYAVGEAAGMRGTVVRDVALPSCEDAACEVEFGP
ncbi:hypothetical protein FOA52_004655 [Chlamydomonas sp. UWO 241]|nr:hypothetical protein FOA52_004655 [Chlamydomonas sp. UWO 241]